MSLHLRFANLLEKALGLNILFETNNQKVPYFRAQFLLCNRQTAIVLAPQLLVLKADSKRFSLHYFLIIGNLISYLIFCFNHFRFLSTDLILLSSFDFIIISSIIVV